jgi:ABC-type transport system substrate-binding protein
VDHAERGRRRLRSEGDNPWFRSLDHQGLPFFGRHDVRKEEQPIITETSTAISQFEAANIWTSVVPQEQVIDVKKRRPELLVYQGDFGVGTPTISYGLGGNSPFKDERVRQAFSLLIDRDLFMETFAALKPFEDEGFPVDVRMATCLGTGWDGWWLNPRGKDFGPNSKYYAYNVAEAKKLLAAAGFANGGPQVEGVSIPTAEYGRDWSRRSEVIIQMLNEGGVKATLKLVDYSTEFLPKYHLSKGLHEGFLFNPQGAHADPAVWLYLFLHSAGGRTHVAKDLDPEIDRLIDAQFKEFDLKKRQSIVQDLQRHVAQTQAVTPMAGDAAGFGLGWPWVQNVGVYNRWPGSAYGAPVETLVHTWIDQTKLKS